MKAKETIKDFSETGLEQIMGLLGKYHAIEASFEKAQTLVEEAKEELSVFPDSQAKRALLTIADYSLRREK